MHARNVYGVESISKPNDCHIYETNENPKTTIITPFATPFKRTKVYCVVYSHGECFIESENIIITVSTSAYESRFFCSFLFVDFYSRLQSGETETERKWSNISRYTLLIHQINQFQNAKAKILTWTNGGGNSELDSLHYR